MERGKRFSRLVAIQAVTPRRWLFACDCGKLVEKDIYKVFSGNTRSCGCYRREFHSQNNRTHGAASGPVKTPEYTAWRRAKMRCHTPTNPDYCNYGARGIEMCPEWRDNFPAFLAHVGSRPSGGTIERIDVNKGYEPGNVRWASKADQALNKRNTRYILTRRGKKMPLIEACRAMKMPYHSIHYWMHRRGFSFEDAVREVTSRLGWDDHTESGLNHL